LIELGTELEPEIPVEHDAPWFALHVRSRCEKVVAASLRSKGYEEFLPLYRSRNRWSDRVKDVDLPLFPGYVFCRLRPATRLPVLTTPGVVSIIGSGKIPQPVEPEELVAIQSLVKSGLPAVPWPFLKAGEHVRIEHGALEGVEGILTAVKKEFRVVLSVTLLQRSVAVEIDRSFIRPILPRSAVHVRDQTKDPNYQHSTVR
jgi:transcription antitermination factor NusG